jgi:hypothetical protein
MKNAIEDLNQIIEDFSSRLERIPEHEFAEKRSMGKWSKKEVIGHLVDSAQNNLRRFIAGQYDQTTHVVYDQDFWVNANGYQQMNSRELILLWKLINQRIVAVLRNMPVEKYNNSLNTGKDAIQQHSLEWLAVDYVKHLKHHLNQVFTNAFDIIYP